MLDVPRVLVRHDGPLALAQDAGHERRHVRLGAEPLDGREERLEVENDGAAEGEAAQRLPVDAEVDAGEGQVQHLQAAEVLVRVAGGHEEGLVDFEAPGSALDGAVGREAGEVSVFGRDRVWSVKRFLTVGKGLHSGRGGGGAPVH